MSEFHKTVWEEVEDSLPDYIRELKPKNGEWGPYKEIVCCWMTVEELTSGTKANRFALGHEFKKLRDIYSERNIGGNRRTSGHGTFENECLQRGYKPRTVRDLIADYEASISGKPLAAEKRKARAVRKAQALEKPAAAYGSHLDRILTSLPKLTPHELEILDRELQPLRRKARAVEAPAILPATQASTFLQ